MSPRSTDTDALAEELVLAAREGMTSDGAAREGAEEVVEGHPAIELLAEYLDGALDPETEESLADHLVACRPCAQELLALQAFEEDAVASGDPGALGDPGSEFRTNAAWQTVRKNLPQEGRPAPGSPSSSPFRWRLQAIAAALLLTTVGLSISVGHLQTEIAELRQPQVNPFVVNLALASRSLPAPKVVEIPAGQTSVTVRVFIPDAEMFSGLDVELLDLKGREIWSRRGLQLASTGALDIVFRRPLLDDGRYRLHCLGSTSKGPRTLIDQEIRIRWL